MYSTWPNKKLFIQYLLLFSTTLCIHTTGKVTSSYHYTVFLYITCGLYTIFFASTQGRSSCDFFLPVRPGKLTKRPISNSHPLQTDIHLCKLASFSCIRTTYYISLYNSLQIFDTWQQQNQFSTRFYESIICREVNIN